MSPIPTDFTLELGTPVDLNKKSKYGLQGHNSKAGRIAAHAVQIHGWFMTWTHHLFKEPGARYRRKVIIRNFCDWYVTM